MISKELLSKVLGLKKIDEIYEEDNMLYFCELNKGINIYELAHKCKEWAIFNHYDFTILVDTIVIYYEGVQVHTIYNTLKGDNFIPFSPAYEIKACQWIFDNKEG